MGSEVFALIYGLTAAVSFGTGDFCGGFAAKRNNVFGVIVISQLFGLTLLVVLSLSLGEPLPGWNTLLLGGLAGVFGMIGLLALYRGLATGRMGIVAPISAVVGAFFPVIVGIFMEGAPSSRQMIGLLLGLCAIWYLGGGGRASSIRLRELGLPITAGLAFGFFFIIIDQAGNTSILWPLVMARLVSITMIAAFITVRHQNIKPAWNYQLIIIVIAGLFDAGGNILFALAARLGRLDISATITSLYPAATILLAWFILRERLTRPQWFGVATALIALVLIAS